MLFLTGGLIAIIKLGKSHFKNFFDLLTQNKILFLSALSFPFLIGLMSSFFISKCPILDGVLFFLVIAIPSLFFGLATGYYSFSLTRKYSLWIFLILFLVILLSPLVEFFLNPQIYFYNPIFGFYPGTIYDEDLSVDKLLIGYRVCNFIFFTAMIFVADKSSLKENSKRFLVFLVLLLIASAFIYFKPALHFATDKVRLEKNLSKSISTEHFQIHFPDSLNKKE